MPEEIKELESLVQEKLSRVQSANLHLHDKDLAAICQREALQAGMEIYRLYMDLLIKEYKENFHDKENPYEISKKSFDTIMSSFGVDLH